MHVPTSACEDGGQRKENYSQLPRTDGNGYVYYYYTIERLLSHKKNEAKYIFAIFLPLYNISCLIKD